MSNQPGTMPAGDSRSGPPSGSADVQCNRLISRLALILGALASGRTTIAGLPGDADALRMAEVMRAFGARVVREGATWMIDGVGNGCLLEPLAPVDFGDDSAAACLAVGLAGVYDMRTTFVGEPSLSMAPVLDPLRRMGVQVLDAAPGGGLPVTLQGPKHAAPIVWRAPFSSAEMKAAVLLAALNTSGVTTVIEPEPTHDRVERMLKSFGVNIIVEPDADGARRISLEGRGRLVGQNLTLPLEPSPTAVNAEMS